MSLPSLTLSFQRPYLKTYQHQRLGESSEISLTVKLIEDFLRMIERSTTGEVPLQLVATLRNLLQRLPENHPVQEELYRRYSRLLSAEKPIPIINLTQSTQNNAITRFRESVQSINNKLEDPTQEEILMVTEAFSKISPQDPEYKALQSMFASFLEANPLL